MKLFTKVSFTSRLILAPSGKLQCILSREGRCCLWMISPMHWTPLRMALQELKNTMFYNWLLTGLCSMLLPQWLCNFLPIPFLPQAILSIFLFLQSDDVRLSFLILGNLLQQQTWICLAEHARQKCICSPVIKWLLPEGPPAHFCVRFCIPKPAAVCSPPNIF